jgi:FkbM family methyltransferase
MSLSTSAGRFLHSLSLRMPQSYAIRSGLRVYAANRAQNALFWSIFTSSEYLSFVPHLVKSDIRPTVWIDCGAAIGYVTLLFNHLIRSGVLSWELEKQLCIEPSAEHYAILSDNICNNKLGASPVLGIVGKKEGSEVFHQNSSNPWSSSIQPRFSHSSNVNRTYYDLTSVLAAGKPCMLKIDIEGAEFSFIESYASDLDNVLGIIIEFHKEMGDIAYANQLLSQAGFHMAHNSLDKKNREVCLYLRQ